MVAVSGNLWRLAPSLVALIREADERWPDRAKISDGSIGDLAHSARTSDHNPSLPRPPGWVDAIDLTEDFTHGPNLPELWHHLIATRDDRVKYLIYEGRIVKSYVDTAGRAAWVAQPYTGLNAHRQHLHVSVTPTGRFATDPWFPPVYAAPEPAPEPIPPMSEEDDDMLVIYRDRNGGHFLHDTRGPVIYALSKMAEVQWFVDNGAKLVEVEDATIANAVAACG